MKIYEPELNIKKYEMSSVWIVWSKLRNDSESVERIEKEKKEKHWTHE